MSISWQLLDAHCYRSIDKYLCRFGIAGGGNRADVFADIMTLLSYVDSIVVQGSRLGIAVGHDLANNLEYWGLEIPVQAVPLNLHRVGYNIKIKDERMPYHIKAIDSAWNIYWAYSQTYNLPSEVILARAALLWELTVKGLLVELPNRRSDPLMLIKIGRGDKPPQIR